MDTKRKIGFAKAVYDPGVIENLRDVIYSGNLCTGEWSEKFAKGISSWFGGGNVVLCNSGSSGNLLAIGALELEPGDEVITTACCFPTTVSPIVQCGGIPVFIDVELGTYNTTVDRIKDAITPRTKAVVLAHTLGNPFNVVGVRDLCNAYGLALIEDCCDAFGSEVYEDGILKPVGCFGDMATVSFYPAHHISTGEGGAVVVNNPKYLKAVKSFRDWGRDCTCDPGEDGRCGKRFSGGYDHKYVYSRLGYNLKMTELQAAVGVSQLEDAEWVVSKRRENWDALLCELLDAGCGKSYILHRPFSGSRPSWFGFALTCGDGVDRNKVVRYLESVGIQTRPIFAGNILRHPCMEKATYWRPVLENSDTIYEKSFWVGVHPYLSSDDISYMAKHIKAGSLL